MANVMAIRTAGKQTISQKSAIMWLDSLTEEQADAELKHIKDEAEAAMLADPTAFNRKLNEEAWVGIIDKAGRRWNLSTYAEMVVRTKLQQAHVEGVRVETLERGVDLAVISSHGAKDACGGYEGIVISINGQTPGYKTYKELRQGGKIFHPNCKHHISPIRDFKLLPELVRLKHEKK